MRLNKSQIALPSNVKLLYQGASAVGGDSEGVSTIPLGDSAALKVV